MVEKKFDKEALKNYLFDRKTFVPKEAMGLFAQMLYKELNEYCEECEDDRMMCVLSPRCPERVLQKIRILASAEKEELPQFCYSQYINTIRRFLEKRTNVYRPIDNIIFNEDFFEIFFTKISKKLLKAYLNKDIDLMNLIIEESDMPEVKINFPLNDNFIFRKIIQRDKLIKSGTFIYHISDNKRYLIIWFDNNLFIMDFVEGITICNAHHDPINDLKLISLIFNIYFAESEIYGNTVRDTEDPELLNIEIEFSDPQNQLSQEKPSNEFNELLEFLQKYYFKIKVEHLEDPNKIFKISLQYNNHLLVQERKGLIRLTYDSIHQLMKLVEKLKNNQEE